MLALVVGDNADADVAAPQRAGFGTLLLGPLGISLPSLATALTELGPKHPSAVALIAGRPVAWGGHIIIEAPNLNTLVDDRTRFHCILQTTKSQFRTSVIRRKSEPPALVIDASTAVRADTLLLG